MAGKNKTKGGYKQPQRHIRVLSRTNAMHMDSGAQLSVQGSSTELNSEVLSNVTLATDDIPGNGDVVTTLRDQVKYLSTQLDLALNELRKREENYDANIVNIKPSEETLRLKLSDMLNREQFQNEANVENIRTSEFKDERTKQDAKFRELKDKFLIEQQLRIDAENAFSDAHYRQNEAISVMQTELQQAHIHHILAQEEVNSLTKELNSNRSYVSNLELKLASLIPLPNADDEENQYVYGHLNRVKDYLEELRLDIDELQAVTERPIATFDRGESRRRFTIPPPLRLPNTSSSIGCTSLPTPTSPGLSPVSTTMAPTHGTEAALKVQIREQAQVIGELQSLVRDLEREVCKTRLGSAAQADLHLEYLKNVLVKYYTPGEEQYRDLFFNVISHILKLSRDEQALLRHGMGEEHPNSSASSTSKEGKWFGIF